MPVILLTYARSLFLIVPSNRFSVQRFTKWPDPTALVFGLNKLRSGERPLFGPKRPCLAATDNYCATCGWRIVISPATGHVTLHPFAGLARVVLVVADFKGIRDG